MESDAAAPAEPTPSAEPEDAAPLNPPPSDPTPPAPRALTLPAVVALCLTMLAVGLIVGYTGHPIVAAWIATVTPAPSATPPPTATIAAAPQPAQPAQLSEAELAQRRAELMDYLVANTRHFRGDPEAAITLIEFSDFQ